MASEPATAQLVTAGRLSNLNPIVPPDPVGVLPLAPGLQVLLVILLLAFFVLAWRRWLAWRDNRYRREALRALRALPDDRGIPDLLRRAALSAYDRERVAPLLGAAWHRFLDETAGQTLFSGACGARLDQLSYGGGSATDPTPASAPLSLREAATRWLKTHRRDR